MRLVWEGMVTKLRMVRSICQPFAHVTKFDSALFRIVHLGHRTDGLYYCSVSHQV